MLDPARFLRPIAHRGLHDPRAGLVENTLPAFAAAVAQGYGIECDLQPAAEGLPIVFHDATTDRLLDRPGRTRDLGYRDILGLRHRHGVGHLPTFAQMLEAVGGRVPVLAEIKSDWGAPDFGFLRQICQAAKGHEPGLAVMSFDPAVVEVMADLAPDLPRGLVSGALSLHAPTVAAIGRERAIRIEGLEDAGRLAADFVAFDVRALPSPRVLEVRAAGLLAFAWTVTTDAELACAERWADAPIFEGLRPKVESRTGSV
ncbi:MAG: glycerophosphodiester phosphodiesterase family protein [Hyphomicrobiaceae bacterium]|nr:glycerophosphodiester phosphodiesterase family protein [Hyphomicrobiaceae bacterium]